jgi:hypothetical protein
MDPSWSNFSQILDVELVDNPRMNRSALGSPLLSLSSPAIARKFYQLHRRKPRPAPRRAHLLVPVPRAARPADLPPCVANLRYSSSVFLFLVMVLFGPVL